MKYKIAIGIPVYNGAATVERSLQSLAEQEFREFHVYICENHSTDNTLDICEDFCKNDNRFEIVRSEKHLDILENSIRSVKIAAANGEYFCTRACDDTSTPDFLSRLLTGLEADKSKLLGVCSVQRIDGDDVKPMTPNKGVFNIREKIDNGRLPRNLSFPAEWYYGLYRSQGGFAILMERLGEYPNPWAGASYIVAEFVVRDLIFYDPTPIFKFYRGSNSQTKYGAKTISDKIAKRWKYTIGCYRLHRKLPPMSTRKHFQFFRMFWNDARRKTGYYILGFI